MSSTDETPAADRSTPVSNLHWLWLSLAIIGADQASKQLVVQNLTLFERIKLFDWLNLTLMHNTGAAFSILTSATPWFFIVLSVLVALGIGAWLYRNPGKDRLFAAALAMILGGALGNAIDRATRGFVVDFVDFHIQGWHYPAFNAADSAIVLGAILVLLDVFRPRSRSGAPR